MNKPKIILTRRWHERVETRLCELFDTQLNSDDHPMSVEELQQALQSADAVLPTISDKITAQVLGIDSMRTKMLGSNGVGFNHIDLQAAKAAGLTVSNTPEVLTNCTADLAMTLLLMVARRAGEGERHVRSKTWSGWHPTYMMGTRVTGKTLGLIGMGRIARAVAARAAHGFAMRVVFYNPSTPRGQDLAGLNAQACNSAEMGLGLLHLLNRHRSDVEMREGHYAQFLGYDNCYFFAIVHPVLQFALKRAGVEYTKLPEFIFTNEFYHLENRKFSTSQGHGLWGREFLEHMSADEARFYLSLNSPELSEANFQLSGAKVFAESLRQALEKIDSDIASIIGGHNTGISRHCVSRGIEARIKFFCEPRHFSSRAIAQIIYSIISYLSNYQAESKNDGEFRQIIGLYRLMQKYLPIFMIEEGVKNAG